MAKKDIKTRAVLHQLKGISATFEVQTGFCFGTVLD